MTKIEEILKKHKTETHYYADQEWYDKDVEKAMIEYSNFCVAEIRYLLKEQNLKMNKL